ncbi:MAG TPA: ATP-binding cassette domain-containing protein [Candidatus Angelobacter sp.]
MILANIRLLRKSTSIRRQRFSLDVQFSSSACVTVISGPSGSGKTTILQCMAGLLAPDSGLISIDGQSVYDSARGLDTPVQHRRVGYVFQDLALFPHMTAAQNIGFGVRAKGEEKQRVVRDALEKFHITAVAHHRPAEISGGEKQRVALARALVTHPRLLLLDEPFTALDDELKQGIMKDLKRWLTENAVPALLVTHDREEARTLGDRVLWLKEGRVTLEGGAQEPVNSLQSATACA